MMLKVNVSNIAAPLKLHGSSTQWFMIHAPSGTQRNQCPLAPLPLKVFDLTLYT
jgi:hypothetical protein